MTNFGAKTAATVISVINLVKIKKYHWERRAISWAQSHLATRKLQEQEASAVFVVPVVSMVSVVLLEIPVVSQRISE